MGRAPNSGAPQRVSAHVVPKAQAFVHANHPDDEDDKTTIEAGWEEEASTTVEQGDVADKLRALGLTGEPKRPNTSITSTGTGSSVSDEPTVDDQRGVLAQLPPPAVARLHITSGNDAGRALEVRPGKTYTVGRGIDNDLVLTDIAVSRKHFDLRHENGAWVLADRGSGNGTVVNTRIEDAPFMLASGDVIEIGNTAFRFELPNAPARAPSVYRTGETTELDDDLDASTVSGKPYRELVETPREAPPPAILSASPARPKTLPPPAPLPRPRTQTGRPAMTSFDRPLSAQMAIPAMPTQVPMAPMAPMALGSLSPPLPVGSLAGLPPMAGPSPGPLHLPSPSTTMPLPQMANRPPMNLSGLLDPAAPALPGTLPGQGAPVPPLRARLPFSGSYSSEIPTQRGPSPTRPPMIVQAGMPNRDATSTALVPPTPYGTGQPPIVVPPPYATLQPMARRTKLAIGGASLALLAGIATIAVIRESSAPTQASATNAQVGKPIVEPIEPKDGKLAQTPKTKPTVTPITAPAVRPTAQPVVATRPQSTPPPPAHTTAPATNLAATPPAQVAPQTTRIKPPEPRIEAKPEPKPEAKPEPKPEAKPEPRREPEPKRVAAKPEPRKPEPKPDKKPTRVATSDPVSIVDDPPEPPTQKRHSGKSTQDIKSDAAALYRSRNFGGAASLISSSLSGFSGEDAQELRSMAAIYSQLGKAYNIGVAPGTKPTEAYQALRRAISYDRDVGAAYTSELQEHLATTATRAAVSFMASKEYEQAFQAVRTSEGLGNDSSSNKAVREKLEAVANDLLRSAQGDLQTDPDGGRRKAQQVLGIVDAKSPLYAKAQKLATGN